MATAPSPDLHNTVNAQNSWLALCRILWSPAFFGCFTKGMYNESLRCKGASLTVLFTTSLTDGKQRQRLEHGTLPYVWLQVGRVCFVLIIAGIAALCSSSWLHPCLASWQGLCLHLPPKGARAVALNIKCLGLSAGWFRALKDTGTQIGK